MDANPRLEPEDEENDRASILDFNEAEAPNDEDTGDSKLRDLSPDDFDGDEVPFDDRVRGAGRQSLEELTVDGDGAEGLQEGVGGLRADVPEPNVNDPYLDADRDQESA